MKQATLNHLKNLFGWKFRRKLVVFCIDDYGNVRQNSTSSLEAMERAGVKADNRFDRFDTLETREDLEMLYEVLSSVKDKNDHPAVFTPYALSCNIDFEAMAEHDYQDYVYETLSETYKKLVALQPEAYTGAWDLWQEGIKKGLMQPEFHGREHFNLKVFEEKLSSRDPELMTSLKNRSLASIGPTGYPTIGWTAAYSFWDPVKDTARFPDILKTGLETFKAVYGYEARVFTPPAQQLPESLYEILPSMGLLGLDRPFYQTRHVGFGKYQRKITYPSYNKTNNLGFQVRNVVFEPTNGNIDHVSKAMAQVSTAFRWHRPALISSHRVNFCGHIDPKNREKGLNDLKALLKSIVTRWPDVEFISAGDLAELMRES